MKWSVIGLFGRFMNNNASDGCISHQLGSSHEWPPYPRSVEWSPSHMANQLLGDAGHVSSTQTLSTRPEKSPCVGAHRQHSGGLLYQSPGCLRSCPLYKLVHQILSLRAVHIPGHLNMGADILSRQGLRHGEWMLHPEVKQIWRVLGQAQVDLFATCQTLYCALWFFLTPPALLGLDAMVQTWQRLRLYAFAVHHCSAHRSSRESVPGWGTSIAISPFWPGRVWFSDLISLLDGSPWGIPIRRDLLSQVEGMIFHPWAFLRLVQCWSSCWPVSPQG